MAEGPPKGETDPFDCAIAGDRIDSRDLHGAVVIDVDLGAGYFADLPNHLAAADLGFHPGFGLVAEGGHVPITPTAGYVVSEVA